MINKISIIVAVDNEGGFAKNGKIPWSLPKDMKHFKEVTTGGICVMGRKTFLDMEAMAKKRKIKEPSLKNKSDAFINGYKAYKERKEQFTNPYSISTEAENEKNLPYWEWNSGWLVAKDVKGTAAPILPNRESIVLSRSGLKTPKAKTYSCLREVLELFDDSDKRELFILGGEKLFIEGMHWASKIYLTVIDESYGCDKFFPVTHINKYYKLIKGKTDIDKGKKMYFMEYQKI